MSSTHIRIPEEVKRKLDNLSQNGETAGSVIARLISYYENAGTVNNEVDTPVNSSQIDLEALVNKSVNDKLTDLQGQVNTIVNSGLTQINERLEGLEAVVTMTPDDEQLEALKNKIQEISENKLKTFDEIASILKLSSKGRISEMTGAKNKRYPVSVKGYNELMNLSSQKSSSEGT